MRNFKILNIFLLLIFALFSLNSNAQYKVKEYPLYSADAYDFFWWDTFTYTDYVFLGSLYYSEDEGNTFYPFQNHLCPVIRSSFANGIIKDKDNENIIYMSLFNRWRGPLIAPFARSLDGGKTLEFVKDQFDGHLGALNLFQDAGGTLYIRTTDQNLSSFRFYKSTDKGVTWQRVEIKKGRKKIESFGSSLIWADPVIPNFLYCAWHQETFYGFEGAFLVSRDGGENWERRENGLNHNSRGYIAYKNIIETATQSPQPPYRIYIVNGNGYVEGNNRMAYSDDRGKTWHEFKMGKDKGQFWSVRVNPKNKKMLYAVGSAPQNKDWGFPFYKSKDSGKHWKRTGRIIDPISGNPTVSAWELTVTKNGRIFLYGCNNIPGNQDCVDYILKSDDEGETFEIVTGFFYPFLEGLVKTTRGTIITEDGRHRYKSYDGAKTFQYAFNTPKLPIKDMGNGYLLGRHAICEDTENANECQYIAHTTAEDLTEWIPSMGRIIIANPVRKSDDFGKTVEQYSEIPPDDYGHPLHLTELLSNLDNPDLLVAAGYYIFPNHCGELQWDSLKGAIYLSEDGGYNWQEIIGWEEMGSIISLKRDECNPNILIAGVSGFGQRGGVFVSEDFGHTWERRSEGLIPYHIEYPFYSVVVSTFRDGVGYAGVNLNGGIYKTENYGINWIKIADNPVHFDDDFIKNFVCFGDNAVNVHMAIPLSVLSMTDILPLDDEKESLLISTLSDGLFIAEKEE